jgi:hypothetical protein
MGLLSALGEALGPIQRPAHQLVGFEPSMRSSPRGIFTHYKKIVD